MARQLWSWILSLCVWLQQVFTPCTYPEQLYVRSVDRQQYLGQWHFKAATSHREADIQQFRVLDNIWFNMEETAEDTLLLTGHTRVGESCMKQTWTYRFRPDGDDLELDGRPQRRNLIWTGTWINCTDCIIFQEVEPPQNQTGSEDSLNRFLLYARRRDVDADVVSTFVKRSACHTMAASVVLPREKEVCSET